MLGAVLLASGGGSARAAADDDSLPTGVRLGIGGGASAMDGSAFAFTAEIVAGVDVGHYSARFIPSLELLYFPNESFIHWTYGIESLSLENVFHVTPLYALSLAPSVSYIFAASTAPPCYDVCHSPPYVKELLVGGSFSPLLLAFGPKRSFELGAYARVEVGVKDGTLPRGLFGVPLVLRHPRPLGSDASDSRRPRQPQIEVGPRCDPLGVER
jgi:hypothetical protein